MNKINKRVDIFNFIDGGIINNNPHVMYIKYINQIHNYFLDLEDLSFEKKKKLLTQCNELLSELFDHNNDEVLDYWIGLREMIVQEIGLKELDDDN